MDKYKPGIGISAGVFMLKWRVLDEYMVGLSPNPYVFINFESVLHQISKRHGLVRLITNFKQEFVLELESSILNLVANYKMYFGRNGGKPKIFLYYTDLDTKKQLFSLYKKNYRTFYFNKYNTNPENRDAVAIIKKDVIKEVALILKYVENCYFIEAQGFDSSLIPLILQSEDDNVIITGDVFDTLYYFRPHFKTIFIRPNYSKRQLVSSIDEMIRYVLPDVDPYMVNIFGSELYYRLLLTITGSKVRSIEALRDMKIDDVIKRLKEGVERGMVLRDFTSLSSIIDIFPNKQQKYLEENFKATSLDIHYDLLAEADKANVREQIIDKIDVSSLESLNNARFLNFPINLQGLL